MLACVFGFLILRRRGVYFSLLTLALSAMLYAVAFRWTDVTGGENGLGGIMRPVLGGFSFENTDAFYALVARDRLRRARCCCGASTARRWARVLVAIRENEQRARFVGYPTDRYKLVAFVVSATLTGLAGMLLLFNNRMTSAEPISVAFSGELLAMVIIGGMRSFLGPALGALFFVIFRDSLSRVTENWLLYFGLLFVAFVVFSPDGLVGPLRARDARAGAEAAVTDAAMAQRQAGEAALPGVPASPPRAPTAPILEARRHREELRRHPRGAATSSFARARPHAARADRTQRRRQDDRVQPDLGHVRARRGHRARSPARPIAGLSPERITRAGVGRSFQITNLFAVARRWRRTCASRCRRATRGASGSGSTRTALADVNARDRRR